MTIPRVIKVEALKLSIKFQLFWVVGCLLMLDMLDLEKS